MANFTWPDAFSHLLEFGTGIVLVMIGLHQFFSLKYFSCHARHDFYILVIVSDLEEILHCCASKLQVLCRLTLFA